MIYLDAAATTFQKPRSVSRAVERAFFTMTTPGRGNYNPARSAADTVFRCREAAAEMFSVPSEEQVVFTMNATHGLNIAIKSLVHPGDTVVISGYEHNAVVRPLYALGGVHIKVAAAPLFDQRATLRAFERLVTPEVRAVICNHVSNVFGFVLPIEKIAALCRRRGVPLIIDASQSAGVLPVSLQKTGAAFIAMPGHKGLYGPQGTGLLLCSENAATLIEGGTGSMSLRLEMPSFLPDRLEAGTQNIPGIAGLLEGIRFVRRRGVDRIASYEKALAELLKNGLRELPGVRVFGTEEETAQTGVVSFLVEGMDCERVAEELAGAGAAVRAGLHCAPLAHQTVGTVRHGTIRASVAVWNTEEEIRQFLRMVENCSQKELLAKNTENLF